MTNLHGDVVAHATPDAAGLADYAEATEYGAPRDPAPTPVRYGWLGAHRRSADTLGGLVLMGVRLYNPATGRFLQTDPIPGGNANAYVYQADPISQFDLDGGAESACSLAKFHSGRGGAAVSITAGMFRASVWLARLLSSMLSDTLTVEL